MEGKKIITVMGATGAQGGGLVRALLEDGSGRFAVRAATRDPLLPGSRALAAAGAEVVEADLDDPKSLEQAFEGAYGAYCVTFYWAHHSPERETREARNLAQAARHAGLKHVIWSTLEDTRRWVPLDDDRLPTLQDDYKVPHFDAKGESDRFFEEAGVPTTYLLTSFYWDNLIHFGSGPTRGADGKLSFVLPMGDAPLPGIAAEDIGRCAFGIFKGGTRHVGRRIGIAGEHLTGSQMAASLSRALGEPVRYDAIPPSVYAGFGFPGADDLANMFQFKRDFNKDFCRARSVAASRKLNPRLQSFDDWLRDHAAEIPLA